MLISIFIMESNFYPFQPQSKASWLEFIQQSIPNIESLNFTNAEGIALTPFYRQEDLEYINWQTYAYPTDCSDSDSRIWQNRVYIIWQKDLKKMNQQALESLKQGADSLHFDLSKAKNSHFEILINNLQLDYCALSLTFPFTNIDSTFQTFKKATQTFKNNPQKLRGSFFNLNWNDFKKYSKVFPKIRFGLESQKKEKLIPQFIEIMNKALKIIESENNRQTKDLNETLVTKLAFQITLTNDYFSCIAGLRAFRFLILKLFEISGLNIRKQNIHLETITKPFDRENLYNNMLSNCTQAMSAIVGGTNILTVVPHNKDLEITDSFSLRMSRNISTILSRESHFNKTNDPAAGAYFIETLSEKIAEKTWETFRKGL